VYAPPLGAGEGLDRADHLLEDLLGLLVGDRGAAGLGQPAHHLPGREGLAVGLVGGVHALHQPLAVGDGAVDLGPGGRWQHHVRPGRGPELAVGDDHHAVQRCQPDHALVGERQLVAQDHQRLQVAGGQVFLERLDPGDRAAHDRPDAGPVRVDVGVAQDVVGALGHRRLAAHVDAVELPDVAGQLGQDVVVLVRVLGREHHADRAAVGLEGGGEALGGALQGPVPARGQAADHRGGQPVAAQVVIGEPTLVAHPVVVDVRVVPGDEPPDPLVAVVDLHVAPGRAALADRRGEHELPGPHGEAEVLGGERADRADVDGVDRVRVVELGARGGAELLVVAAVAHLELVLAGDLVTDPDAAGAKDAALGVEDDPGPQVDHLRLADLGHVDPRVGVVVVEVELLQGALAGLVADRAVDRVVQQGELEHLLAGQGGPVVVDLHHHAVGGDGLTRRLQLGRLLDAHQALAAAGRDAQARVVAERADVVAEQLGRLEHVGALGDRELLAVDGQRDGVGVLRDLDLRLWGIGVAHG
jgi:hypothetical protein